MQKQLTKNLTKTPATPEKSERKEPVEIETVKLAKVKTGVMAGICCLHDGPSAH